jgi:hypothetical protein
MLKWGMISIIVYGRNDSYGYNLHKRAALSLNNFAEVLSDPDDEILFVDYNSDRGVPPFPVAIADTLTPLALSKLKLISVSSDTHQSLNVSTHLRTLEPVARNVALRRSNPKNRWILSTNTDMIFVPRHLKSLTAAAENLDDGIYGIPRFELPEGLWESLPRMEPEVVRETVKEWGNRFSLNQITYSHAPHVFDAPGDFQLMLRQDLFDIDGFDESMVLGWHVDSNIAKRISFLRGPTQDLSSAVYGYHCDHTRVETPMHKTGAKTNSIVRFIDRVNRADLPDQRESWGLPHLVINPHQISAEQFPSLEHRLEKIANVLPHSELSPRNYNLRGYDTDEPSDAAIAPFLADLLQERSHPLRVLWLGSSGALVEALGEALGNAEHEISFDFLNPLLMDRTSPKSFRDYDVFVLDYRREHLRDERTRQRQTSSLNNVVLRVNIQAIFGKVRGSTRVVGINVNNTGHLNHFMSQVNCIRTPYSIGISHGKLNATVGPALLKYLTGTAKKSLKALLGFSPISKYLSRWLG